MKHPTRVTIKLLGEDGRPLEGLPIDAMRPLGKLAAVLLGCTESRVGVGESDCVSGWRFHVLPAKRSTP